MGEGGGSILIALCLVSPHPSVDEQDHMSTNSDTLGDTPLGSGVQWGQTKGRDNGDTFSYVRKGNYHDYHTTMTQTRNEEAHKPVNIVKHTHDTHTFIQRYLYTCIHTPATAILIRYSALQSTFGATKVPPPNTRDRKPAPPERFHSPSYHNCLRKGRHTSGGTRKCRRGNELVKQKKCYEACSNWLQHKAH